MQWCQEINIRMNLQDFENWMKRCNGTLDNYITSATGIASSYLGKYRQFFTAWDGGNAPEELKYAVAIIAIHNITGSNATLAPQDIDESYWEREYDRIIKWLRSIADGTAELYVQWPGVAVNDQGEIRSNMHIERYPTF